MTFTNRIKRLFVSERVQQQSIDTKSLIQTKGNIEFDLPIEDGMQSGSLSYYQCEKLSYGLVGTLINKKAEAFAMCEPRVLKGSNQSDAIELDKHPLVDLFNYPNSRHTYYDLKYSALKSLEKFGDAYWYVVRDNFGEPVEFWTLPTTCMQIILLNGMIVGYKFKSRNKEINYTLDEIIHFSYSSDKKSPYGMGTIEMNVKLIEIELAIKLYQKRFFDNDAQPKTAYIAKHKLNPVEFNRFKERIFKQYTGGRNNNKAFVSDGDVSVDILSTSPKEADLPETNKNNRNELLAAFGVNPAIAGFIEDVNRANAIEAKSIFLDSTIAPSVKRFDNTLTMFARNNWNDLNLRVVHKIESPSDRTQQLEEMKAALAGKAISINEFREWLGNYDAVKNGDKIGQ